MRPLYILQSCDFTDRRRSQDHCKSYNNTNALNLTNHPHDMVNCCTQNEQTVIHLTLQCDKKTPTVIAQSFIKIEKRTTINNHMSKYFRQALLCLYFFSRRLLTRQAGCKSIQFQAPKDLTAAKMYTNDEQQPVNHDYKKHFNYTERYQCTKM